MLDASERGDASAARLGQARLRFLRPLRALRVKPFEESEDVALKIEDRPAYLVLYVRTRTHNTPAAPRNSRFGSHAASVGSIAPLDPAAPATRKNSM